MNYVHSKKKKKDCYNDQYIGGVDLHPESICVTQHSTSHSVHLQNNQTEAQQTSNHLTYDSPAKYRLQAVVFLQYIICTDRLWQNTYDAWSYAMVLVRASVHKIDS